MRRLLTVAVAAAALASPAAPAVASERYCGGIADYSCRGWVCSLDCFYRDCDVWLNPMHDPQFALCL